jgi:hypothetical protein
MIFSLENGILTTDLDCQFFNLLNINALVPVPAGIIVEGDPRLSDNRTPLDGSVTNIKVAAGAAIVQSKLSLNGVIPTAWLGQTSTTAAQGNLAEYVSHKAQPNGYASLDGTGKIPIAQLPALAGVGTVTNFSAGDCVPLFTTTEATTTTTPALSFSLSSAPGVCWFGNFSGTAGPPTYRVGPLPVSLIPSLDASKVATGVLNPNRLPVAVYGPGNSQGAVPDPGTAAGDPDQYLSRDMTYKTLPGPVKITVITASGAFIPQTKTRAMLVECWGGGGGGGGANCPAGNTAAASGGGGGAYASRYTTTLKTSYVVAIGAGGAGGLSSGLNGGAGVATIFDTATPLCTANPGGAGQGDSVGGTTATIVRQGGGGGGSGGGDFSFAGGDGGNSFRFSATAGGGGNGGDAGAGGGGARGAGVPGTGASGNNYGGGGAGALSVGSGGFVGGAGSAGAIRVVEYF